MAISELITKELEKRGLPLCTASLVLIGDTDKRCIGRNDERDGTFIGALQNARRILHNEIHDPTVTIGENILNRKVLTSMQQDDRYRNQRDAELDQYQWHNTVTLGYKAIEAKTAELQSKDDELSNAVRGGRKESSPGNYEGAFSMFMEKK
jgi:hypothetical protein